MLSVSVPCRHLSLSRRPAFTAVLSSRVEHVEQHFTDFKGASHVAVSALDGKIRAALWSKFESFGAKLQAEIVARRAVRAEVVDWDKAKCLESRS